MSILQGVERYKVILLPHDIQWEVEFLEIKKQISTIWANNIVDIQHFGSTAIMNICAKPILDVAVVVKSFQILDIKAMTDLGYDYCSLQKPDNNRNLFVLRQENNLSLQHIHCYEPNDIDFINCIKFRDYMNKHSEAALAYSQLKERLVEQYADDRCAYTEAKTNFIKAIYAKFN